MASISISGCQPRKGNFSGHNLYTDQHVNGVYLPYTYQVTCSLDELAEAFETLLRDNKNGAVMRCHKPKGSAAQTTYVEQKWTEI